MHGRTNRRRTMVGAGTAFALALTLGACDTTEPAIDDALVDDVALLAADATLEDVTLWNQPLDFGSAGPAQTEPQAAPGEPGGRGGWSGTFSGMRSVTFYDENGDEQDGYDPLLTESIDIVLEIEGEVSRAGWEASIYRERDKTVSGLLGEETSRTWNGTGSSEVSRSRHLDSGEERTYDAVGTVEYEDVVVPIPGSDPRWPLSGTIRRTFAVTRTGPDGSITRSIEVVITFDGSPMAVAFVNGEERLIDLAAVDGVNPVRHRGG
ncbi:MAG: hypothetical protein HKN72_03985 [Gemmatimonadetes bacterium]|nr:hypothetical protein [Gemmatimonadota bacterium]NNL29522.1 hypothetical protein [Gemmatimonadota bacterium]